jgi:Methyltransferase domain
MDTGANATHLPQRTIYDRRYTAGQYDRRSAIRVLTAEREALAEAVDRALKSNQDAGTVNLFDFGYGTGRVTNELTRSYPHDYAAAGKSLRIVAYDVSSVGLRKAQEALCAAGFAPEGSLVWWQDDAGGYISGSVRKEEAGLAVSVVFVHGCEDQSPEVMRQLALRASDGEPYLITTSWYSGLGHIPGQNLRREYFRQLGELTSPSGEMVLSVSSTGDLAEIQPEWDRRRADGYVGSFPVEGPGDVVYLTELGQPNFYHLFGTDLNDHMAAITPPSQHWWVRGIRYPDPEFESQEAEQANYWRVREANESKRGRRWTGTDFRAFHTVAAFRSPADPER